LRTWAKGRLRPPELAQRPSFKRFASSYDVWTAIVAHPTKAAALSAKAGDKVSLYDISDGATWANKAELGVIVSRHSPHDHLTELGIRKVNERKGRGSPFALCARLSSFP
jgi:hypothetical protein